MFKPSVFTEASGTEFCRTMLRNSKWFLASFFQMPFSEEIPKAVHRVTSHLSKNFCSVPFHPLSNLIVQTNSPLLRKYWADVQNEQFGTRVLCSMNFHWSVWFLYPSSSSGSHDWRQWYFWTKSDQSLWIAVPFRDSLLSFERKKNFHTTSLPTQDTETSNVLARISSRNSWHPRRSKHNSHHSYLLTKCQWTLTWRLSGPWTNRGECSFSPSRLGSLEEQTMTVILGNFTTRIQLLLNRFPLLLGKTRTTSVLPLDLAIFLSLLCCRSSVPDIEWNLHRPTLLPSPIWSVDHEIAQDGDAYSSNFTFRISWECVLSPSSEKYGTIFQSPRILCSCRSRKSSKSSAQDGWLLSSTRTLFVFENLHRESWVACWHSQLLLQELKDLAHVLMDRIPCSEVLVLTHPAHVSLNILSHHGVFGVAPPASCFQRPLEHSLVDSLESTRLLIVKRIANCFKRQFLLLFFHRYSLDRPEIPNIVKRFPHSSNHAPPSMVSRWKSSFDILGPCLGMESRPSFLDAIMFGLDSVRCWLNVVLQSLCPKDQEQVTHPCVIQHPGNNLKLCRTARDRS